MTQIRICKVQMSIDEKPFFFLECQSTLCGKVFQVARIGGCA